MESLLDAIQYNVWSKHVWRNGKEGSISGHPNEKEKWVFRFFEPLNERWEDGPLFELSSDKIEEAVPVCKGIAACYLALRRGDKALKDIYDIYTKERYEQYKKDHRLDTDKCDWWTADWERDFYCNYIIPFEIQLNKTTEALFDYISDSDIVLVRNVMNSFIAYLKKSRSEKGYHISDELKVLRYISSENECMLEDMEHFEVTTILDDLESKGYVRVAWVEGHDYEDIMLLDKGRAYMKQFETGETLPQESTPKRKEIKPDVKRKTYEKNGTETSDIKEEYKRRSFNLRVNSRQLGKLYDLLSIRDEEGKRYIDGDISKYNNVEEATGFSKEDLKEYRAIDIDRMLFNMVFSGKDTDVVIVWVGNANELIYFIDTLHKTMLNEKERLLDRQIPGPKIWQLTRLRFLNGKPRNVLDERTGKLVSINDPVEFSNKAFAHSNYPKNTTRLDDIITMLAPKKEKNLGDEIRDEFNQHENFETKHTQTIGQLSNKGFHDVNHKRK